jgi:aminoglycoside N3'-acetyltransferase
MANAVKYFVAEHAPRPLVEALRGLKRRSRSARYRIEQRRRPVTVTKEDLAGAFRHLGLGAGDGVYMHSAMSKFGRIEGGPATVVAALDDVVGPNGLIAMPAFPVVGNAIDYLESDPVFDVRTTPSRVGAITEHFRRLPEAHRSLHPTHSVCARGPDAAELVAGHEEAPTPFGEGTPFKRMIERGMHQMAFGSGVHVFTLYHTFECIREGGYPLDLFSERTFSVRCIDAEGRERRVTTRVHDPAYSKVRIDNVPSLEAHMRRLLLESGRMRSTLVGKGEILLISIADLLAELESLLQRGITIYDVELSAVR